jgi:hypothetical protein
MQNKQLSQERDDGESRREYKSPTLRKLGKLADMTLQHAGKVLLDGKQDQSKTG